MTREELMAMILEKYGPVGEKWLDASFNIFETYGCEGASHFLDLMGSDKDIEEYSKRNFRA